MAYTPKSAEAYDDAYNLFYAESMEVLSELRRDFIREIETRQDAAEYLVENEADIKNAFYSAVWDALIMSAYDDKMANAGLDFMEGLEDLDDDLLPDHTGKTHHS